MLKFPLIFFSPTFRGCAACRKIGLSAEADSRTALLTTTYTQNPNMKFQIQEVLKTLPEVPFTVEILDKCNIACLIDQFVPNLAPATDFARRIRKWRNASMQREKAKIVKYFTYGTLYDFGGTFVPDHVLKLLTDMMCFDDLALVS